MSEPLALWMQEVVEREAGWWIDHLRDLGYTVTPPNPDATFHVRSDAPATSKALEPKMRFGTKQDMLLGLFDTQPDGLTDDDVEQVTGASHQSISAMRNTLVRKGLLRDSGRTRLNRWRNEAIIWVRTDVDPDYRK